METPIITNETEHGAGGSSPAMPCSAKPSYFSKAGLPRCSCWGKIEIELLAWAYVTTQARNGDEWKPVTVKQAVESLTAEEIRMTHVRYAEKHYADCWKMIGEKLTSQEGAFDVRGMSWGKWKFEKMND